VERFHKTLRAGCLTGNTFAGIEAAQAAIDAWVATYNTERPHQSIGMATPAQRFALANTGDSAPLAEPGPEPVVTAKPSGPKRSHINNPRGSGPGRVGLGRASVRGHG
jgi:Integrase core domain